MHRENLKGISSVYLTLKLSTLVRTLGFPFSGLIKLQSCVIIILYGLLSSFINVIHVYFLEKNNNTDIKAKATQNYIELIEV